MKTSPCKSCAAPIIWAISAKTGKRMPLDAAPVDSPTGKERGSSLFALLKGTGDDPIAITSGWFHAGSSPILEVPIAYYRSHFATCAHADSHRKQVA